MNSIDSFLPGVTSRRHFLKWLGLGLVAVTAEACGTNFDHPFTVVINGDSTFSPSPIVIPKGASVTWINRNVEAYTITCDPDKITDKSHVRLPPNATPWDSGAVYPGQEWTTTFTVPGYFVYTTRLGNPEASVGAVVVTA